MGALFFDLFKWLTEPISQDFGYNFILAIYH
jgi:hypothetical protein